jgi:hypothetical protein
MFSLSQTASLRWFYALTQTTQDQLDDLFWAAFQVGDEIQRKALDLAFDTAIGKAFTPDYLRRLLVSVGEQTWETSRVLVPGENSRLGWQELKNKYEVYNLVKHIGDILGVPAQGDFELEDFVRKAYALGAYPDLWAVEGLGHDYAMRLWNPSDSLQNLLTSVQAATLPEKSLTMMHAGQGLAFAEQLLKHITPYDCVQGIRNVIEEFVRLCRDNSREGYVGAAYESLGLVTRTWHAEMMPLVDSALQEIDLDIVSYFWHGAGRALYFLPYHFVPGSPSPWSSTETEGPSEIARLNLRAGLSWATNLVNLRQPEIIAATLRSLGTLTKDDAISNGIVSSLIMSYDITPGDIYVEAFSRYQPPESNDGFANLWREMVSRPVEFALEHIYPQMKQRKRLGELFHYQTLADLISIAGK